MFFFGAITAFFTFLAVVVLLVPGVESPSGFNLIVVLPAVSFGALFLVCRASYRRALPEVLRTRKLYEDAQAAYCSAELLPFVGRTYGVRRVADVGRLLTGVSTTALIAGVETPIIMGQDRHGVFAVASPEDKRIVMDEEEPPVDRITGVSYCLPYSLHQHSLNGAGRLQGSPDGRGYFGDSSSDGDGGDGD